MGALPFQGLRIAFNLRKPERCAIVMGRREAKSLGLESKAPRGRRPAPGLDGPRFIARPHLLAGAPRARLPAQRESIYPLALLVGDVFNAAVSPLRDDALVVAASEERL